MVLAGAVRKALRMRGLSVKHGFARYASIFLVVMLLLPKATPAEEKRLSVYASVANYALPIIDRGGREYVGLLELLEPLGRVSAAREGSRWRLRFNSIESEFIAGKTSAKVRGRNFNLTAPFLIDNSRGMVATSSLGSLLPLFVDTTVMVRENARRIFIGNVAIQPAVQLDPANAGRVVFNFSAPVSPTISTEPGKLRMLFKRDAVVPLAQPLSFENKAISQINWVESNGTLELDVAANTPLMANFSNGGRTITVSTAQQPTTTAGAQNQPATNPPSAQAPATPAVGATPPTSGTTSAVPRRVQVVVDPAHGGDERGAALSDTIGEKSVTLGFARLLRHELEQRGFSVMLSRESDANVGLDQRAGTANGAHAGIFITLHAASQGTGVRVYTALLPVEGLSKGNFHAWNAAQAPALPVSRTYAGAIIGEMQKHHVPVRVFAASLRPMNNVAMPAVAVELGPGPNGISDLPSANYQQQIAAVIAEALAPFRDRLGAQP